MVGAAVAVLPHGATEFRDHQDYRVGIMRTEGSGETCQTVAERLQMVRELTL
jgi:hypothetical protein